ncbi:MAG: GTP-binding protein [Candidatus Lokiarchaeota archaeon]|nr:GTP-binding protein [Candidatus Lokiarchaeota archaeon]
MIRGVYLLGPHNSLLHSKEYVEPASREALIDFLLNLTEFLSTQDLGDQIEFMNLATSRLYYSVNGDYTFLLVADKADDMEQITEKIQQLETVFMEKFVPVYEAGKAIEGLDNFIDSLAVTMVKVAILGFAGVGKTTTLHLLRGETLPLKHDPTIGVTIKKLPSEVENANIVLWDLAGQSRFKILWGKMIANAQVVVIVTDSTLENVLKSKKLVGLVKEKVPNAKIIGIANKQDLPTALTPDRVGKILGVKTYELVAIDVSYRDRLIQIIRRAILEGKAEDSGDGKKADN